MKLLEAPPIRCPIAPAIGACVPTAAPPNKPIATIKAISIIRIPLKKLGTLESTNDLYGSLAVVQTHSSPMTAFGWKADIQPGRVFTLTDTGRSEVLKLPKLDGS
jgi:hypothetical protein